MKLDYPFELTVVITDIAQITAVYALLGGAGPAALMIPAASGNAGKAQADPAFVGASQSKPATVSPSTESAGAAQADTSETATDNSGSSADDSGEIDAHGHPWSADLHASTKGKTKEGLWRMKPGAARPDPLPGFPPPDPLSNPDSSAPSTDTGTSLETPTPSATSPIATDPASDQPATSAPEDDEFAAFRNAAAASDATDQAAAASVPARTYSDADLGALCNQAAVKLGDPTPIKEIIAKYVPDGQVAHSRNIPEDKRATFVGEVETKAGIEFAG